VRSSPGFVVRVERPGVGPINDHQSETEMNGYAHFAHLIANNGTVEDLNESVDRMVELLRSEDHEIDF
jgi:hypothetical protein